MVNNQRHNSIIKRRNPSQAVMDNSFSRPECIAVCYSVTYRLVNQAAPFSGHLIWCRLEFTRSLPITYVVLNLAYRHFRRLILFMALSLTTHVIIELISLLVVMVT